MTSFHTPDFFLHGWERVGVSEREICERCRRHVGLHNKNKVCSHFEFKVCISCNGFAQPLLYMFLDGILEVFTSSIIEYSKFWTNGELKRYYSLTVQVSGQLQ